MMAAGQGGKPASAARPQRRSACSPEPDHKRLPGRIYPIVGTGDPATTRDLAIAFVREGVAWVQIREKRMSDRQILDLLLRLGDPPLEPPAGFIVNDRVDLALASNAAGVHLGQDDLPAAAARSLLGTPPLIGLSTHDERQFESAQHEPIDYVAVGPIFASATKTGHHPPLGIPRFAGMAAQSRLPVVAIGGITAETAPELWEAGANSVAVISDLLGHPDPVLRLRQYLRAGEEFDR